MTDYLRRLAERAVGAAPAVRPALPPRFAPAAAPAAVPELAPSGDVGVLVLEEEIESGVEPRRASSPAESRSPEVPSPEEATAQAVQPIPAPHHLPAPTDPATRAPLERPGIVPESRPASPVAETEVVVDVSGGRAPVEPPRRPEAPPSAVRPSANRPSAAERASPDVRPAVSRAPEPLSRAADLPVRASAHPSAALPLPAAISPPVPPVTAARGEPRAPGRPVQAVPTRRAREGADPAQRADRDRIVPASAVSAPEGEPAVRPVSSVSARTSGRDAEPAGPPVIEVTIGRVEVRAVSSAPAARPAKPAAPAPAVSLEDYLRARGGGR